MPRFVPVAKLSRLEEGRGIVVSVEGTKVALFLCGGEVFAMAMRELPHVTAALSRFTLGWN